MVKKQNKVYKPTIKRKVLNILVCSCGNGINPNDWITLTENYEVYRCTKCKKKYFYNGVILNAG